MDAETIWTVGHSNHTIEHFLRLLTEASIAAVADIRRFPGSRRQPHFQQEKLQQALRTEGIGYRHFPELGGRRSARLPNSPNTAWRVESFNAYADHLQTEDFAIALGKLKVMARSMATAMMCSEAVPWRCHRRLIGDALVVQGWTVLDILGPGRTQPHALTEFAEVVDGTVIYPASPASDHP